MYMYIYIYIHICVCMYICMCVCVCVFYSFSAIMFDVSSVTYLMLPLIFGFGFCAIIFPFC